MQSTTTVTAIATNSSYTQTLTQQTLNHYGNHSPCPSCSRSQDDMSDPRDRCPVIMDTASHCKDALTHRFFDTDKQMLSWEDSGVRMQET